MRILIVDDDPTVLRALERLLGAEHDVVLASNGVDAVAIVHHEGFDAALVDVHLAGRSGFELREALLQVAPALRVVLVTGGVLPDEETALAAVPHLDKPFKLADLERVLGGDEPPPAR